MSNILKKGECGFGILIEQDSGYLSHELNRELISENFQFKENEPVMVTCILQKWGVKNKNGRIYSKEVLLPQVIEYQKLVDNNQAMGETDHPDSSVISLQNISHMITKMWWGTGDNENTLYGKLKLIVSPGFIRHGVVSVIGDKILLYIMNKIKLGISSRGVGTLKEIRGDNYVQNDFELIGFDLVSSPSTPGAFLFPENSEKEEQPTKKLSENVDKLKNALDIFLL